MVKIKRRKPWTEGNLYNIIIEGMQSKMVGIKGIKPMIRKGI